MRDNQVSLVESKLILLVNLDVHFLNKEYTFFKSEHFVVDFSLFISFNNSPLPEYFLNEII